MTLKTRREFLFFISVIGWLVSSIWLYPLPEIGSTTDSADWLLWCAGFVVIVLGLISTVRTYRQQRKIDLAIFSLAFVLFFVLLVGQDSLVVYSFVIDKIFVHKSSDYLSWNLILGGGHGMMGIIQTLVFLFFIPIIFAIFGVINSFQIYAARPSQQ